MILVFDLDDTLFDSSTYVKGGFQEVSKYLYQTYAIPSDQSYSLMNDFYNQKQQGTIFDSLLKHYDCWTPTLVKRCVSVYRMHKPHLKLDNDALRCLKRFKHLPLYVVTDGNKTVQSMKTKALKLDLFVRHTFITYRYGIKHSKPSPYCFLKICELEKVQPQEVCYIADNPHKDFIGIKPLGFKTIRVQRGPFQDIVLSPQHEADLTILSLDELNLRLLEQLMGDFPNNNL